MVHAPAPRSIPRISSASSRRCATRWWPALTLDTFHRHADKVAMANIAQLVNCLQSPFLAHEDRFVTTPTFHVFEMYGAHVGGQSVRTVMSAPRIGYQRVNDAGIVLGARRFGVDQGPHADAHRGQPARRRARCETEIAIRGAAPGTVKATTIAAERAGRPQHLRPAASGRTARDAAGPISGRTLCPSVSPSVGDAPDDSADLAERDFSVRRARTSSKFLRASCPATRAPHEFPRIFDGRLLATGAARLPACR